MHHIVDGQVSDGKRTLAYRRRPAPGCPVLLMLHGVTDSGAVWDRVASRLAGRFDIVTPDARGHGRSMRLADEFTWDVLGADAAAVLESLDVGRALVWGHSMGAASAVALAVGNPEKVSALVLEDPPFLDGPPPAGLVAAANAPAVNPFANLPEQTRLSMARAANPTWHEDEIGPWVEAKMTFDPEVVRRMADALDYDWRTALGRITAPTLLLTGDARRGALITPEVAHTVKAALSTGAVVYIAGAGHSLHRDDFEAALDAVLTFVGDVADDSSPSGQR